jgi:FemAB-related protein (PEP-CTERM system-associated)
MNDSAALEIGEAGEAEAAQWDAFVRAHPAGTFFHLSGWRRALESGLGHRSHYLRARVGGELVGVLPLGRVRSFLFGDSLASIPFGVYGGVLAKSEDAARTLEDAACELAERLRVDYLEMRNLARRREDWPEKTLYVTFRRTISPNDEENMKAIPQKQRAMVRKGVKGGLVSRVDRDLETFYRLYSESVRNLGTPVFPKRYFRELMSVFGEDCETLVVYHGERPLAAVMSFYFRDEVLPFYGGGSHEARDLRANDFMYWELMRRAAARGLRTFDFGRSKRDSGSYHFKRHWGFEEQPLHYEYRLVRARAVPDVSPVNPRYAFAIALWRRLPLRLTQSVGPLVARYLG